MSTYPSQSLKFKRTPSSGVSDSTSKWLSLDQFQVPQVLARDARTVEIRQFYPLPSHHDQTTSFSLDVYFFFPLSFGLSAETWDKNSFYQHSRVYSRLHAPSLTLANLGDLSHPLNPAGILAQRIQTVLEDVAVMGKSMTYLSRMFGAEVTDSIQREANALRNAVVASKDPEENERLIWQLEQYCADCMEALRTLRRVDAMAEVFRGVVPSDLMPSLGFAEEYGCAVLDEVLSKLVAQLEARSSLRDGKASYGKMRMIIARTLERLNHWRRSQGFVMPDSRDFEYYSYRINLLKKELQRSLYVNLRETRRDPFLSNSAAMVAAGLAAVWAGLAQVPVMSGDLFSKERMILIGSAAGAYILKDRIKDLVKNLLLKKMNAWDHDFSMSGDTLAAVGLGSFLGRAKEKVRWQQESKLPDVVRQLRRAQRTVRGVTTKLEQVLHYCRHISLNTVKSEPLPQGYGLRELLRFDLESIIGRLDEPVERIHYYNEAKGVFQRADMPRVYHLNIVIISTDLSTGRQYKTRFRVVLNQHEILRVEQVISESEVVPIKPL